MGTFQWCCCCQNLTAVKYLAVIFILSRIATGYAAYEIYYHQENPFKEHVIGIEIYFSLYVIFDIFLLYGCIKKVKSLLLTWTILAGIGIVYEITFTLLVLQNMEITIIEIVSKSFTLWAIATVVGAMKEIDLEREPRDTNVEVDHRYDTIFSSFVNRYGLTHDADRSENQVNE